VGAFEVQLERVDPLEPQLRRPDRREPIAAPIALELVQEPGIVRLERIESPSGSKPVSFPAGVRPTRWKLP
jgi:hypothetical protein